MTKKRRNQPGIGYNAILIASQDLVSANLEEEAVILNLKDGVYYGLNPVGARIWQLLQGPRMVKEILDIILSEYEVEARRGEHDLMELLQELLSKGLIEVKDDYAG